MSANVEQSKILAKLKKTAKGSWSRAKDVEPKARGQGGFPPNLKNLVAKVSEYKLAETEIKTDDKGITRGGDPYFSLSGVVVEPPEYAGRRATHMWFINESEWATVEENLSDLANDIALLGKELPDDIADLPEILQALVDEETYYIFNTGGKPRKEGKTPRLYIQGLAEGYTPTDAAGEVDDTAEGSDDTGEGSGDEAEEEAVEADADEGDVAADDDGGEEADTTEEVLEASDTDEVPYEAGDAFNIVIGKEPSENCAVVKHIEGDKYTIEMLSGVNKGKKYNVSSSKFEQYVENPKPKPKTVAAKPAPKAAAAAPKKKTAKKK